MTPQEALLLLDRVASMALLSRPDHVRVQQAVETLAKLVNPEPTPAKEEK